MAKTGVIETASGDLLRWGHTTFALEAGESAAPLPLPTKPKRKWQKGNTQHDRWNGSAYVLVTSPAKPGVEIEQTISGGTITIPTSKRQFYLVIVDVESGSVDDLNAILGGDIGDQVVLRIKSNSRTIIVRDDDGVGADKIEGKGDFPMNEIKDKMHLIRRNANVWDEISRSPN